MRSKSGKRKPKSKQSELVSNAKRAITALLKASKRGKGDPMLTTTANKLKPDDAFTSDEGATWHTVAEAWTTSLGGGTWVVLLRTAEGQRIWLFAEEEIVVRL